MKFCSNSNQNDKNILSDSEKMKPLQNVMEKSCIFTVVKSNHLYFSSFQLDTFGAVYKKLTGKDVNFEFPEYVL